METTPARPFALVKGDEVLSTHGSYMAASTARRRFTWQRESITIRDDRDKYAPAMTEHKCSVCAVLLNVEQVRRYTCGNDQAGTFYHCCIGHENVTQERLLRKGRYA